MDSQHFFLVGFDTLIDVHLKVLPKLVILLECAQLLTIDILGMQLIKHLISAINMGLNELWINNLIFIFLFGVLLIVQILLVLAILLCLSDQRLINQNIVQVLKILQLINCLELVTLITLIASKLIRIVRHVQHL